MDSVRSASLPPIEKPSWRLTFGGPLDLDPCTQGLDLGAGLSPLPLPLVRQGVWRVWMFYTKLFGPNLLQSYGFNLPTLPHLQQHREVQECWIGLKVKTAAADRSNRQQTPYLS